MRRYCQSLRCKKQSNSSAEPKCLSKPKPNFINVKSEDDLVIRTHVGKYWTKLRPNNCDIVMIENMNTSGSFMAIMSPWTGLDRRCSSSYTQETIKVDK